MNHGSLDHDVKLWSVDQWVDLCCTTGRIGVRIIDIAGLFVFFFRQPCRASFLPYCTYWGRHAPPLHCRVCDSRTHVPEALCESTRCVFFLNLGTVILVSARWAVVYLGIRM